MLLLIAVCQLRQNFRAQNGLSTCTHKNWRLMLSPSHDVPLAWQAATPCLGRKHAWYPNLHLPFFVGCCNPCSNWNSDVLSFKPLSSSRTLAGSLSPVRCFFKGCGLGPPQGHFLSSLWTQSRNSRGNAAMQSDAHSLWGHASSAKRASKGGGLSFSPIRAPLNFDAIMLKISRSARRIWVGWEQEQLHATRIPSICQAKSNSKQFQRYERQDQSNCVQVAVFRLVQKSGDPTFLYFKSRLFLDEWKFLQRLRRVSVYGIRLRHWGGRYKTQSEAFSPASWRLIGLHCVN